MRNTGKHHQNEIFTCLLQSFTVAHESQVLDLTNTISKTGQMSVEKRRLFQSEWHLLYNAQL
jgi:hypothetical protein